MIDKLTELLFIAVIVAIFSNALFETIKEWFLKLKAFGKITVLFSLGVLAAGLILVEQHVPKFEALHFTIPVPVPTLHQLSIQQVTFTTHAPLLEAIAFGLIMTFVSIADALHAGARFREANPTLTTSAQFREYSRSPLVLYPLLGLSYKVLVIGSGPSASMVCMYAASVLGLLVTPIFWKNRNLLREPIELIVFAVLFAAALTFAALL